MQRLQQSGELVEQHTDPLTNALARQQHGVTKGSVDAAVAQGKIPLLLTDVEGAQAARARGLDCWCILLAPVSPEVQHLSKHTQHHLSTEMVATCQKSLVRMLHHLTTITLKATAVGSW